MSELNLSDSSKRYYTEEEYNDLLDSFNHLQNMYKEQHSLSSDLFSLLERSHKNIEKLLKVIYE